MSQGIHSTPQELLDLARLGKKLKPKERQAVVTWLEGTGTMEQFGDYQLSQILQCKPTAIRRMVKKARQGFATAITAEDAMQYMVNYLRSNDTLIRECRKQVLDPAVVGTGLHPVYIRLLKELEAEKIEMLQSIGVIPKELGRMTAVEENWKATISTEGVTGVHEVENEG
jgi:hypothetical protein